CQSLGVAGLILGISRLLGGRDRSPLLVAQSLPRRGSAAPSGPRTYLEQLLPQLPQGIEQGHYPLPQGFQHLPKTIGDHTPQLWAIDTTQRASGQQLQPVTHHLTQQLHIPLRPHAFRLRRLADTQTSFRLETLDQQLDLPTQSVDVPDLDPSQP